MDQADVDRIRQVFIKNPVLRFIRAWHTGFKSRLLLQTKVYLIWDSQTVKK